MVSGFNSELDDDNLEREIRQFEDELDSLDFDDDDYCDDDYCDDDYYNDYCDDDGRYDY